MKATGTPKELASRLEMSERNVYRFINILKERGVPVRYNKIKQYYEFECNVRITLFTCETLDNAQMSEIIGGQKFFTPFLLSKNKKTTDLQMFESINSEFYFPNSF